MRPRGLQSLDLGGLCWTAKEEEGVPMKLMEALEAFAVSVEVAGLRGDGQLLTELEGVRGGKGWRLSRLVRLVEKNGVMEVQAACVVSKAKKRARSGMIFKMQALAVKEELRGRGLATKALRRPQVEMRGLAGGKYRMMADMAACMAKEGVGFYGRQGWTGEGGVWQWDSRTSPSRGNKGN